jgi:hypothetical protein
MQRSEWLSSLQWLKYLTPERAVTKSSNDNPFTDLTATYQLNRLKMTVFSDVVYRRFRGFLLPPPSGRCRELEGFSTGLFKGTAPSLSFRD